jgi:hypothetical protein
MPALTTVVEQIADFVQAYNGVCNTRTFRPALRQRAEHIWLLPCRPRTLRWQLLVPLCQTALRAWKEPSGQHTRSERERFSLQQLACVIETLVTTTAELIAGAAGASATHPGAALHAHRLD